MADLALEEQPVAYAAFTKGILHQWTYLMRTVPDIGPLFEKLETAITNRLSRKASIPDPPSKDVFLSCQYDMVGWEFSIQQSQQSNNHNNPTITTVQ